MKTYVVIFALLLFGYAMQAQQYIIRYDLAGENISYLKVKNLEIHQRHPLFICQKQTV